MRYELNELDVRATLYFGQGDSYVLSLYRDDLARVIDLASRALSDLDHAEKTTPSGDQTR